MISDDDLMDPDQELLNYFSDPIWINVTVRHTPWVIDKGLFVFGLSTLDAIAESNITNGETQFIDCFLFCSQQEWSYIGLQKNRCYCLSPSALTAAGSYLNRSPVSCLTGFIPQCPDVNEFVMAVYQKDPNTYQGHEDCLSVNVKNNVVESVSSIQCSDSNPLILCINIADASYRPGSPAKRYRVVGHCEQTLNLKIVDFQTVNSTKIQSFINNGNYWLNNFRESYVLKPAVARHLRANCVTAQARNGTLKLNDATCSKPVAYTVCIKETTYDGKLTMHYSTSTASINNVASLEGWPTPIIIVAVVSVFTLIALIIIVIVICLRKHRASKSAREPLYATIQKEMIRDGNVTNHGDSPEVANEEIDEDNTYDHTDFTTRQPLQQTDVNNYDTMENLLVTGESIYHHAVIFKASIGIIKD